MTIRRGVLNFLDGKAVYKSRSTGELMRSFLVLRTCQVQPLVRHAETLLSTARRFFGAALVDGVVRRTFFAHFCAGEDEDSIRPTVQALRAAGVRSILDYAAEADLDASHAETRSADAGIPAPETGKGAVCRVYHYKGEDECDARVDVFRRCIEAVHNVTPEGFAAIKLTALGLPDILERQSTAITEIKRLFNEFDQDGNGVVTHDEFAQGYRRFFEDKSTPAEEWSLEGLLHKLDEDGNGQVDYLEWTTGITLQDLPQLTAKCRAQGPLSDAVLSTHELEAVQAMTERIEELAQLAKDKKVRLMIDAEQTYFQPAIDNTVVDLQERFNQDTFTIFNTYQCYLKEADQRLLNDLTRAKRRGYRFGAKLVRGAYMVSERQRAAELGLDSPVHDTIEQTHACYHRAIECGLERIATGDAVELMVASHNQTSVEFTLSRLAELGLSPDCGVYFGQLLGMSDHLTFVLGANGFSAYKYVPYGAVNEVMPYLLRRAQENSSVLGSVGAETRMIQKELWRRIVGGAR